MDIPNNDLYVLLGDFNAHVGSGTGLEDDPWLSVRGQYGVGKMNDAGRNFSASCRCSALAFITPVFTKGTFTRLRGAILVPSAGIALILPSVDIAMRDVSSIVVSIVQRSAGLTIVCFVSRCLLAAGGVSIGQNTRLRRLGAEAALLFRI